MARRLAILLLTLMCVLSFRAEGQVHPSSKGRDLSVKYLRAVALLAAPDISRVPLLLARPDTNDNADEEFYYRVVVTRAEAYESLWVECLQVVDPEESEIQLKYSVRLREELFRGNRAPGFEGVSVHIVKWLDNETVVCSVEEERYKIVCSPNPSRITVSLMKSR